MATPTVGAITTAIQTAGSSIVIDVPTHAEGDLLVVAIRSQQNNSTNDLGSSGWTRRGPAFEASSNAARILGIWTKVATGSEPASYTFSGQTGSTRIVGAMIVLPKVSGQTPQFDAGTASYTGTATGLISRTSMTTGHADALVMTLHGNEVVSPNSAVPTATPSGFTERVHLPSATGTAVTRTTMWVGTKVQASAGATGDIDVSWASVSGNAAQSVSFWVDEPPSLIPPTITTTSLGTVTEGAAFSTTIAATGSTPITWAVQSGSLPTGLSLNASTGAITGTPTTPGAYSFTLRATNSEGFDDQAFSGSVAAAPSNSPTVGAIETAVQPSGTSIVIPVPTHAAGDLLVAVIRSQQANSTNDLGSSGWTRRGPAFEASSNAARILGIWTKVATGSEPSSYAFTGQTGVTRIVGAMIVLPKVNGVTPAFDAGTASYTGTATGLISRTSMTTGHVNALVVAVHGNEVVSPNNEEPTALPAGFTERVFIASSSDTAVTRTALWVGTEVQAATGATGDIDVSWASVSGNAAQSVSFWVAEPTPPTVTTTSLSALTVGAATSQTIEATGATPITWAVQSGSLPAGLSLASGTGVISGTPTTPGAYSFTLRATNAEGFDDQAFSGSVAAASATLQVEDGNGDPLDVWLYNGTIEVALGGVQALKKRSYTIAEMDAAIAANQLVYWAHRGGSANWSEMTMRAYTNAVWHPVQCLEVSVHRSSDGVWIMSHDANLTRVTPTTHVIASTASSTLLGIAVDTPIGGGIIGRLEDLLTAYPEFVLIVDNKPNAYWDEFYALLETVPDCYNHIIIKIDGQYGGDVARWQATKARGFKTCGYWYPNNYAANLPSKAAYCDYIGMQYDASSAIWNELLAYGKPLWGHVLQNVSQANACVTGGARILQCANVETIVPLTAPPPGPPDFPPSAGMAFYLDPALRTWNDLNLVRADGRPRVMPHYFPLFPRSLNNPTTEAADYYVVNWTKPAIEGGSTDHRPYGGMLRDRPIWRSQLSGTADAWAVADCKWEIQQAKAFGIDGFVVDTISLSPTNNNNRNIRRLLQAADEEGDFKVVMMIDPSVGIGAATAAEMRTLFHDFIYSSGTTRRPSAWFTPDGKYVIGAYVPGSSSPSVATWQAWQAGIATEAGAPGVHMLSTTSDWGGSSNILRQVSSALGDWGGGDDPLLVASRSSTVYNAVTGWGIQHFMPVGLQQVRPKSWKFDESVGLTAMMKWWERYAGTPAGASPVENPKFLQPVTWSDYAEGSTWMPSVMHGWTPLSLSAFYIHRIKTGAWPTILRDGIYLAHRPAPIGAVSTYGETNQMVQWAGSGRPSAGSLTPPPDMVQAVVMLTAPATVRIWSHTNYTDFSAPAGVSTFSRALVVGNAPKVEVIRGGSVVASVTSGRAVTAQPYVRDGTYYFANNFESLALRPTSPSLM